MATKMSQNKQEFMNKMVCKMGDYRRNPEESVRIWNNLSKEIQRKKFYLKPQHFFEAAWMLRDYLNIDHRYSKILDGIGITYLDGKEKRHIDAIFDIYKNNKIFGVLFLTNSRDIHFCVDDKNYYFGPSKHMTVKEFYQAVKEVRDFIKIYPH